MSGSPETTTALQAAQARIEATRRALRAELVAAPARGEDAASRSAHRGWRSWRRRLRRWPLAGAALQALQGWWRRHPLQPAGDLLAQQASDTLRPLVRRHPTASVAAAVALGALVVLARPWRWPALKAAFSPLPGQAGHLLQDLLASPLLQAAVAGWLATIVRGAGPPASHPGSPAEAEGQPR